jgi:uncharacterized protein (DUF1778 family)
MVENLTRHIAIRATPGRKQLYTRCAARDGLRLSEWLRRLADRAAEQHVRDLAMSSAS